MTVGELLDKLNAAGVTGDMEVMSDTNPVWAAGVDEGVFSIFSIVAQKLWEQREKVWTTETMSGIAPSTQLNGRSLTSKSQLCHAEHGDKTQTEVTP